MTNGKAMQAILKAAQEDNRISQQIAFQSHLLAQSMKNDSVAMKTVSGQALHLGMDAPVDPGRLTR